jgi:hypothetical protein
LCQYDGRLVWTRWWRYGTSRLARPEWVAIQTHGDFSLVVETFDNSARKQLLSAEIVEDQFAVLAE